MLYLYRGGQYFLNIWFFILIFFILLNRDMSLVKDNFSFIHPSLVMYVFFFLMLYICRLVLELLGLLIYIWQMISILYIICYIKYCISPQKILHKTRNRKSNVYYITYKNTENKNLNWWCRKKFGFCVVVFFFYIFLKKHAFKWGLYFVPFLYM